MALFRVWRQLFTLARAALRAKIPPHEAEDDGCGLTIPWDDGEVWRDLRRRLAPSAARAEVNNSLYGKTADAEDARIGLNA